MVKVWRILVFTAAGTLSLACGDSQIESNNQTAGRSPAPVSNREAEKTAVTAPSSNMQDSAPDNPLTAVRNKKLESMRKAAGDRSQTQPSTEEILQHSARPAPEDSEFAVALTDVLVERRRFLKHPLLSVVEKTTVGNNKKVTITTTDGRTFDLPGDAIGPLSTASTSSILKAAKLELPRTAPSRSKKAATDTN